MPTAFVLLCLWVIAAAVIGMAPRRFHWRGAIVLMLTGLPLLVAMAMQMGPWWTLLAAAAVASVLRWPLIHAGRLIRRAVLGPARDEEAAE